MWCTRPVPPPVRPGRPASPVRLGRPTPPVRTTVVATGSPSTAPTTRRARPGMPPPGGAPATRTWRRTAMPDHDTITNPPPNTVDGRPVADDTARVEGEEGMAGTGTA